MVGHCPDSCEGFVLISDASDHPSVLPRLRTHADIPPAACAEINEGCALRASPRVLVSSSAPRDYLPVERGPGYRGPRSTTASVARLARQLPPPSWRRCPTTVGRRRGRFRSAGTARRTGAGGARIDGTLRIHPSPETSTGRRPNVSVTPHPPLTARSGSGDGR